MNNQSACRACLFFVLLCCRTAVANSCFLPYYCVCEDTHNMLGGVHIIVMYIICSGTALKRIIAENIFFLRRFCQQCQIPFFNYYFFFYWGKPLDGLMGDVR